MTGSHEPEGLSALVIGAGPAGLMAAERLASRGIAVTVCDHMPSPARKFLMAGRGGLNLSHSESFEQLLPRYGAAATRLEPALNAFSTDLLREWSAGLGVATFIGSSGRVFPKSLKASPLLRAWLRRLDSLGVRFLMRTRWIGFSDDGGLLIETPESAETLHPSASIFALGGASWPRLGGDGRWTTAFADAGVIFAPLQPSNSGFRTEWSAIFAERFAGHPLKRIGLTFEGRSARGEAMVTADGIEGGLVYGFSAALRDAIARDGVARPTIDLRPDIALDDLTARLAAPRRKRSTSTHLAKAAGLAPAVIGLLREAGPLPSHPHELAERIKATPLALTATAGIDRAISTAGGVRLDEVDDAFMLKRRPGTYVVGEMLDWEAPTGGYLLHACLATGRVAGDAAATRLIQSEAGGLAPIFDSTSAGISS